MRADLVVHMRWEEERALPLRDARATEPPPPGRREHFLKDHEILRRHLDSIMELALIAAAETIPRSMFTRALAAFAAALEHHDQREVDHLYRPLALALDHTEVEQINFEIGAIERHEESALVLAMARVESSSSIAALIACYRAWVGQKTAPTASAAELGRFARRTDIPQVLPPLLTRLAELITTAAPPVPMPAAQRFAAIDSLWRTTISRLIDAT